MINLKRIDAPQSTITYDKNKIDAQTGNLYEAISIIAKRASQINAEIKRELEEKLEEFAKKVLKKPHEMTPEEKINYYKTNKVYKGMMPVVTKDIGKEKAR